MCTYSRISGRTSNVLGSNTFLLVAKLVKLFHKFSSYGDNKVKLLPDIYSSQISYVAIRAFTIKYAIRKYPSGLLEIQIKSISWRLTSFQMM